MIETDVRNNVSMLESVLNKLNTEISSLEEVIKAKEVWEVVEERRVDELAEEGTMEASIGGVERKVITVLRGAEKERALLNGENHHICCVTLLEDMIASCCVLVSSCAGDLIIQCLLIINLLALTVVLHHFFRSAVAASRAHRKRSCGGSSQHFRNQHFRRKLRQKSRLRRQIQSR